ncbi:MAG: putative trans-acting enoyl reductase [Chroococcopsis gigantea SAG 12.99]|nr:putative trans-acting enoyl reductase [Chroococcopsis gigantea SAG 12.99]
MSDREYDVILYGASGFVGKQTVRYFQERTRPDEIRWAIAGRNREKLEAVALEVGVDVDILVADSKDETAIDSVVSKTKVLLNTAGPFALYGDKIVDACVRFGTHYVDITGETPWVKRLIDRYHEKAVAEGTRIIPSCGFDSVPSDLGTYLVVNYLREQLGTSCKKVKAYYIANGGFNGGTLASGFNLYDSNQIAEVGDPFLLDGSVEHSFEEIEKNRDPLFPEYDTDTNSWIAPFFMGPINSRVVRRSNALSTGWGESYGQGFTYGEYMKFDSPLAPLEAGLVSGGMLLVGALTQQAPIREFLKSFLPGPGSGPSESVMNGGWFRCELLGFGAEGQRVRGLIADNGDPGNRATVKFLCESALCLALNEAELPNGGILTPATGLGMFSLKGWGRE